MKIDRIVILLALASIGLMGAGCRKDSSTTTSTDAETPKEPVVTINELTQDPFGKASVPDGWEDLKIDDLNITLRYPDDWGTASAPTSMKGLKAKTVSFSAFDDQVVKVVVNYYASDYKSGSGLPAYPLTAPSCGALSQLTDGKSSATRISDCSLAVTDGKYAFFFRDSAVNSDVGLLYTGDDEYPLLELSSKDGTNPDTIKKVLGSAQ
jgi:hypothetical protein